MHMLEPESEVMAHLELLLVYIHFCMKISKINISCFWMVVVVLLLNMALVFSLMTRQAWCGVNSQKFNMYYFTGFRDGS